MTENEREIDIALAEAEQENRLLRARNERLMAEAQASNFERTAAWLKACGKVPGPAALSVQIGCHLEEFIEFLMRVDFDSFEDAASLERSVADLLRVANGLKKGLVMASINPSDRIEALDALCDSEVTGNGVAYLAGFDKRGADQAVLASNDAKLVDGKPVILPGGKIGKPDGWKAPDLSEFV
jgi:predicted HAD superfamily Cof-like phosphohydrolase